MSTVLSPHRRSESGTSFIARDEQAFVTDSKPVEDEFTAPHL